MTDHLLVAREGRVRLFRVNGHGADEVASLAVEGPLPPDDELAAWSGALVLMTTPRVTKAPPKPRAVGPANTKRVYRERGALRRDVLRGYADGEWHTTGDLARAVGANIGAFSGTVNDMETRAPGMFERRTVPHKTRRMGVAEYRITDEGRALLAELEARLG